MIRVWIAAICCFLTLSACSTSSQYGPVDPGAAPDARQIWLVPGPAGAMRAVVYQPKTPGPSPLAIISHGSSEDSAYRAQMSDPDYPLLAQWLVARGFVVVVPQRPGHGQTGGPYLETAGSCERPDFKAAGLASAAAI